MRNLAARALPLVFTLSLLVIATGCPDGTTAGSGGTAPVSSQLPTTGKIPKPPKTDPKDPKPVEKPEAAPLDLGPFTRESLAELYRADVLGGEAERAAAYKKHGLTDDAGKPTAKVDLYDAALKTFASERPEEWAAIAADIERARATRPASSNVPPEPK